MTLSKRYGTAAFALVMILVIVSMIASFASHVEKPRHTGGGDHLVYGAGRVCSIEGSELVIQTDDDPSYVDSGKQIRISFPLSGRIKDKLTQIATGTRVSYSRFESVAASGSFNGNDIDIE